MISLMVSVDVKHPVYLLTYTYELLWPSSKALGWITEGPRLNSALALLSLQKGCGVWTLSCDFVPDN